MLNKIRKFFNQGDRITAPNYSNAIQYGILPPFSFEQGGATLDNVDFEARTAALWACVSLISAAIADCPKYVARRDLDDLNSEGEYQPNHKLNKPDSVLNDPSPFMGNHVFWATAIQRLLQRGNSYVLINRFKDPGFNLVQGMKTGDPMFLSIADRHSVDVVHRGGKRSVDYWMKSWDESGTISHTNFRVDRKDLIRLHGPGWVPSRAESLSPIRHALFDTLNSTYHGQIYQRSIWKSLLTRGVITRPGGDEYSAENAEEFEKLTAQKSGSDKARAFFELPPGYDYKEIGFPSVDLQILELLRYSIADCARLYNVPLALIGAAGDANLGAGAENINTLFVDNCLRKYAEILEDALEDTLLTISEKRRGYCIRVDLTKSYMGTPMNRAMLGEKLIVGRLATPNEVRKTILNKPPIDDPEADMLQPMPGASPTGMEQEVSKTSENDMDAS